MNLSTARLAARNIVGDAMDVGGTLRGEVDNEVGDLSKFAAAPERCGLRTRISLAQFVDADAARVGKRLFVSKGAKPRRLENAGGDTDDTHTVFAELLCP